jgi:hypothetical protein
LSDIIIIRGSGFNLRKYSAGKIQKNYEISREIAPRTLVLGTCKWRGEVKQRLEHKPDGVMFM